MKVTCEFSEDYPESSCLLVYREYGKTTLVVEQYGRNDEFPVTISISKADSYYTFGVFGKNAETIDSKPVTLYQYMAMRIDVSSPESPSSELFHLPYSICMLVLLLCNR